MKKTICILLTFVMLLGAVPAAFAASDDPFDLSFVRDNDNIYELSANVEQDCAFITGQMSVKELSFTHKNESDSLYSSTQFDILVLDYLESTRYPVFRLWITLSTERDYEYITSATFTFDGKSYTFSDIADKEWFSVNDSGDYMQKMLIKLGVDDIDFIIGLLEYTQKWQQEDYPNTYSVKLVLHGTQNIEATLSTNFLYDFSFMQIAYAQTNGLQYIDKTKSTPLKVSTAS